MSHHPSCGPQNKMLMWHCDQCGENESAEALLDIIEQTQKDLEQVRVQLAGCSVIACGHDDPDVKRGVYGWSVAYEDIRKLRHTIEQQRAACQLAYDYLSCADCTAEDSAGCVRHPNLHANANRAASAVLTQDKAE